MIHSTRRAIAEVARDRAGEAPAPDGSTNGAQSNRHTAQWDALATALADQRRFGHLLHDSLCQELAGISFACEVLQQRLERVAPSTAPSVAAISRSVLRAMQHARDIARDLNPVSNRPEGLAHSLGALARAVSDEGHGDCRFDRRGLLVLVHDAIVATTLYRIAEQTVRETIEVEHFHAVILRLTLKDSFLQLSVSGDGQGCPSDRKVSTAGRALLHHRAGSIGATLRFDRNQKRGCTVTCSLPNRRGETLLAELRDHHE